MLWKHLCVKPLHMVVILCIEIVLISPRLYFVYFVLLDAAGQHSQVCKLCRDHEKAGFIEGIRLGVLLAHELGGMEL